MPFALTVKSVSGSRAAQSCDGCAAACMHEPDVASVLLEDALDRRSVADVDVVMRVLRVVADERLALPSSRRIGAEKRPAHVVVDPDHEVAALTVELRGFRADQACRTGNEDSGHECHSGVGRWITSAPFA